ncbi:MAG: hypothetical protein ACT6RD_05220 [Brevundimonas sp.]
MKKLKDRLLAAMLTLGGLAAIASAACYVVIFAIILAAVFSPAG